MMKGEMADVEQQQNKMDLLGLKGFIILLLITIYYYYTTFIYYTVP